MKQITRSRYQIEIFRQIDTPELTDLRIRRGLTQVLLAHAVRRAELSVALMDGASVRTLNARYHHRRSQTDVLAFDLRDDLTGAPAALGQIVVNIERARRRAATYGIAPAAEIMLYVIHGCLHLTGYDDHSARQASVMHRREDEMLEHLGYGRPFEASRRVLR
jgi:probable rRNA maturation factor